MATITAFTIANRYGDYIRTGWRNILDCILKLHNLGLLPAQVASDATDESETSADALHGKPVAGSLSESHMPAMATPRRSSGLMGRFGQWLSLDTEEPRSQPTEQQLAAHQRTLQTIQKRHIDSIFTESKFLQADSLLQLSRAIVWAAGRPQKGSSSLENEDQYSVRAAQKACGLAYYCLSQNPKARPLMSDVVETLEPLQSRNAGEAPTLKPVPAGLPNYRTHQRFAGNGIGCRTPIGISKIRKVDRRTVASGARIEPLWRADQMMKEMPDKCQQLHQLQSSMEALGLISNCLSCF